MNGLDENSKQYRRDLLSNGFLNGDLESMIRKGLNDHGPEIVAIVACTQTTPGRNFLQWIGGEGIFPVPPLHEIRQALASDGTVSTVFPFHFFMPAADKLMESLTEHLRGVLARPGAVPVVVLGGGGIMVAVSAFMEQKGIVPQPLLPSLKTDGQRLWVVEPPNGSPSSRERSRRIDRARRYGVN
jgi:hypothetical protein